MVERPEITGKELERLSVRTYVDRISTDGEADYIMGTTDIHDGSIEDEIAKHPGSAYFTTYKIAAGLLDLNGQKVKFQSEKYEKRNIYRQGAIYSRDQLASQSTGQLIHIGVNPALIEWMRDENIDRVIQTRGARWKEFGKDDRIVSSNTGKVVQAFD